MKEKSQGFATLSGVKVETFSRFCEWMYKESYAIPLPVKCKTTSNDIEQIDSEEHTHVYLALAELYVFAQERDVKGLKPFVLGNLTKESVNTKPGKRCINIHDLVQFVYQHTSPASGKELEPLRAFTMSFCADGLSLSHLTDHNMQKVLRASDTDLMTDYLLMLGRKTKGLD